MQSDSLREAIQKAEAELGENGRVLIRPSGTEPLIRVMVEAWTEQQAQAVTQALVQHVENLQKSSEK
jgi:phosphoglucosamine mutase